MARNSRSTFRRGISETQRRKKQWIDMNLGPALGFDLSGGALQPPDQVAMEPTVSVLQFPSQPGFTESTILRIRGNITVPKSTYAVAGGGSSIIFAFGIGLVSDVSAEALAVPNPATAVGYDWDGWLFIRQSSVIAVDPVGEIVDVKAMRKWKSGDSIVFVAGLAAESGTPQGSSFSVLASWALPSSVRIIMATLKRVVRPSPPVAK